MIRTVRGRLAVAAALGVTVVLVAAGAALLWTQRASLTDHLDETLSDVADELVTRASTASLAPVITGTGDDDTLAQVLADGEILAATPNAEGIAPLAPAPPPGVEVVRTGGVPTDGGSYRTLSRTSESTAGTYTVHVAANLDDIDETMRLLRRSLVVVTPVAAALLALLVWWLAGRALRPVEAMRAEVTRMSGGNLHERLPEPRTRPRRDDEIARLARTLNSLLDRIESSHQRQARFVADASHELRSPLTRVRAELEVDLAHPEQADVAATQRSVLDEVLGMQQLVDDLLVLARAEAGAVTADAEVDLDELVLAEAARLRGSVDPTVVRIDTSHVSGAQVRGDATQLGRVVRNLADNARRHASTTVWFTLAEHDGTAVLTVADDGPGIPADQRERVFERFARVDEARDSAGGGAGLGLAIVREVVTAHGGRVVVDVHPSGGARFVITLPVA